MKAITYILKTKTKSVKFYNFADLANAYFKIKGYYPFGADYGSENTLVYCA